MFNSNIVRKVHPCFVTWTSPPLDFNWSLLFFIIAIVHFTSTLHSTILLWSLESCLHKSPFGCSDCLPRNCLARPLTVPPAALLAKEPNRESYNFAYSLLVESKLPFIFDVSEVLVTSCNCACSTLTLHMESSRIPSDGLFHREQTTPRSK